MVIKINEIADNKTLESTQKKNKNKTVKQECNSLPQSSQAFEENKSKEVLGDKATISSLSTVP